VCCSVLQCVAMHCSALQRVASFSICELMCDMTSSHVTRPHTTPKGKVCSGGEGKRKGGGGKNRSFLSEF